APFTFFGWCRTKTRQAAFIGGCVTWGKSVTTYDEAYLRKCAQEARAEAEAMTSAEPKREMTAVAEAYEQLAGYVARRPQIDDVSLSPPSPLRGPVIGSGR